MLTKADKPPRAELSPGSGPGESPRGAERRVWQRIPIRGWVRIWYRDFKGRRKRTLGRLMNVSASGLMIGCVLSLEVGSPLIIGVDDLLIQGAHVRHCSRRAWYFKIGLEFVAPVTEEPAGGILLAADL